MHKLGLIGKNISHSKSKQMYEEILGQEVNYKLFDYEKVKDLPTLEELFTQVNGISITSPYKKSYNQMVKIIGEVRELGIINCIRNTGNGFEATNTDFLAVENFLKNTELLKERQIVLLGNGSMSEITKFYTEKNNIKLVQLSRSSTKNFEELSLKKLQEDIGKELFIINACSREYQYSGEVPDDLVFWDYNYGHNFHFNRFTQSNTRYIDGIDLLKNQAIYALNFWGINV